MAQEKSEKKKNFQTYLILGIIFFSTGLTLNLILQNPGFFGMTALGFVFLIVAISHYGKWKQK